MKNQAPNSRGMESYGQGIGRPYAPGLIAMAPIKHQESEILRIIKQMEAHVQVMGIAARFPRDSEPSQDLFPPGSPEAALMQHLQEEGKPLNGAGAQRLRLLMELAKIRVALQTAFGRLEDVRQEIMATTREDDGTLVPQPFPRDLKKGDFVQKQKGTGEAGE